MAIRGLVWLTILFAAAVLIAVMSTLGTGQVLIIQAPYRIDMSMHLFGALLTLAFIAFYLLIRLLTYLYQMPARFALYRMRARSAKAYDALYSALNHLFAGRFARAEKMARTAASLNPENKPAAALIGARAAHQMHEYARRDGWLAQVIGDWQEAKLLSTAEMRLDARDAEGALAALSEMSAQGARRHYARQIALRAHQQLKHWPQVLQIIKSFNAQETSYPSAVSWQRAQQVAAEHLLYECRHEAQTLLMAWHSLPVSEQHRPRTADLAAQLLIALERHKEARQIVEEALLQQWEAALLRRYSQCAGHDPLPLIQRAEAWQQEHPDDPELLFTLGCLCQQQKLWGKAQAFLETTLHLTSRGGERAMLRAEAYLALARLHEKLGQHNEAGTHYRASALAFEAQR
ncbi:heme biosynthesis HemY N-terminal domain-containing protein [Mycoavidus sp. B2-EB]|uniref:heme biosynthesis HemY N-terminal domain-containing protein n=1 Tax=Mycoavidus sp. B2-EB TaxID=2651972 RepID=UPI00162AE950|nr:heme biosynthesis HemY N-terminal domain-containing protein [Mycoavidus sp. B2-EB]BBO59716.1 porphyrin biosynthesis-like protein [Mycoavidus sp. B2-EB]